MFNDKDFAEVVEAVKTHPKAEVLEALAMRELVFRMVSNPDESLKGLLDFAVEMDKAISETFRDLD